MPVPYFEIRTGRRPCRHSSRSVDDGVEPVFDSMIATPRRSRSAPLAGSAHTRPVSMVVRLSPGRCRVTRRYRLTSVGRNGAPPMPGIAASSSTESANSRLSGVSAPRWSGSCGMRVLTVAPRGPRVLTSTQLWREST